MGVLVGLDVGTTGVRVLAVNREGAIVASAGRRYALTMPRPGWTEQEPDDWWNAARDALSEVAGAVEGRVDGIGLTGQMHGAVFLDGGGKSIRPAILWNDQRTEAQCREITAKVGANRLLEVCGNPALTGFQAPKLLWLREEEPDAYRRVARVLLPKDYIRYRLTGELATDPSDASGTLLLDLRSRAWSQELLDRLEVPREWLPAVVESSGQTGQVGRSLAEELGLGPHVPVAAGAGDNAAAAIGVGVVAPGVGVSSIGTSGVVFAPSDAFTPDGAGRVHAFCHAVPGGYHLMGVTLAAGAALEWWRGLFNPPSTPEQLAELAATAAPGSGGLLFLPYLYGERSPLLDPRARGAFVGLTASHGAAELTRAVMEGVVFSLRESLEIIAELAPVEAIRATGGGARSRLWAQLQADVYNRPVALMGVEEGAAYGAALLAGVAAAIYPDLEAASQLTRVRETIEPDRSTRSVYDELFGTYLTLYPGLSGAMHAL
ncbi:MAG: xylulokinase [Chloroflexi bacterium]|nr:MAG: xylulokinase [Chloroflexota bacterium]